MKLISKTLHYNVKSNEQTGMWTEKILCDILKISFNIELYLILLFF